MTFCAYHCSKCGSHFTSLEAFDAHREGPVGSNRACSFPDNAGLVERFGVCKIAAGPPRVDVAIYEHERASRVRDYRKGQNSRETASTNARRAP